MDCGRNRGVERYQHRSVRELVEVDAKPIPGHLGLEVMVIPANCFRFVM